MSHETNDNRRNIEDQKRKIRDKYKGLSPDKYRYNDKRDELGLLLQDREVMKLLLRAKSRKQISKELSMPIGSVNESCSRIYQTLECNTVAELIVKYGNYDFDEANITEEN